MRKIAGNCGKIAVPEPNLPKPQGATSLRRRHTWHPHAREGDKRKEIADHCGKLRQLADLNPPTRCSKAVTAEQWRVRLAVGKRLQVAGGVG